MTFGRMIFGIMTFSLMAFGIMTLRITKNVTFNITIFTTKAELCYTDSLLLKVVNKGTTTLSIMTFGVMTFGIMTLRITKNVTFNITIFIIKAELCYADSLLLKVVNKSTTTHTQHNDIRQNDIRHNDIWHNDIRHNDIWHDTQNNKKHCDTHY